MTIDVARLALIGAQLIGLGNELIELSDSFRPPDDDTLWLARAIQGEGAALFGDDRDEVGLWIAHTALNRLPKSWWPDTVAAVVQEAFYGAKRIGQPEQWAVDLAQQGLNREEDIAGGALFMLSGKDLENHEWHGSTAHRIFKHGKYELYFFRGWPGD